jgi:phosphoribosylanthranilate isomerase
MTQVKICGLSTAETIDAAVEAGADFVGLNFFPASPRHVTIEQAAALAARVPAHVGTVGIFVDPDDALIAAAAASGAITIAQLHNSTPARAAAIAGRHGLPVWAAIGVATSADVASGRAFAGAADRLLFDAKTPKGADLPGGMGLRFDWRLLAAANDLGLPWGLAGGLDQRNVAEAIRATGAALVDAASGVEERAGVKSVEKIMAFIKAARAA